MGIAETEARSHAADAMSRHFDLAVVGSGIVGLAHAAAAERRGLSVVVIDRAASILGASVRNFGHLCLTAQDGQAREYGEASRTLWLDLARDAGFWIRQSGTVVVAQARDEFEILAEFRDLRGEDDVVLLSADEVRERVPVVHARAVGGAILPRDLQVDPREAATSIARWLKRRGVEFLPATTVLGVESGLVHTSRGEISADTVVVAVNHDVDQLFPEIADRAGIQRCGLDMMLVDAHLAFALPAPLFTGWSLIRYAGFAATESAATVRTRLSSEYPELFALDLNQMYTQRPDGGLIVGDTHYRSDGLPPFQDEFAFESLLSLARGLFGIERVRVRERWQGVYASAPNDFLIETPCDDVRVVSVTTGVGMTTGLGLGERVIADLYSTTPTAKTATNERPTMTASDSLDLAPGSLAEIGDEDEFDEEVEIELVVLDLAGTTVVDDGLVERAFARAAEAAGIGESLEDRDDALAYVRETMGQSKIEVFRALSVDEDQAQHANAAFESAYAEFVETEGVEAVPGAQDVIRRLRESGLKVALTTGFARATQDAIIDALGWRDAVDVILSPADAGRGRPYPDLPLTALLRTGATSVGAMVVVGDTASDIASGLAAGAGLVVGVLTGAHDEATLNEAGADAVIESIADLPELLGFDD